MRLKFKLLLLLTLCLPTYGRMAHALTLGDIKVEVRRLIDDKANPKIGYTDAEIISFVNETQREIVNQTWCLQNTATQTLSVRTTYYALPDDMLAIYQVTFRDSAGRTRNLEEVTEKSLWQDNPDYERQSGQPFSYFVRQSTAATDYELQIAFLPVPSSSTATGTARIDYYNQATSLTGNADVPFDGILALYPYHYALVYGTVARLKLLDAEPEDAKNYMTLYTASVQLMKDRLGAMPNYNPGFKADSR